MAKKETTKAPAAAAQAAAATPPDANAGAAAPAVAAPKVAKKPDIFAFVKQVGKDEKLAPQARVIVNTIESAGKPVDREELTKLLDGKLQTRQPIGRIVTYYQKELVTRGYISITEQA